MDVHTIQNFASKVQRMKERHAIRVALVLSYLLLVAGGKDARTTTQWENTSPFLMHRQINKTIVMEGEDIYDCIDVNLQPALSHPLLKDHKIQMEPSSFPIGLNVKPLLRQVISQAHMSILECPTGMVPILRNRRRDQISSKKIDIMINKDKQQEVAGIKYYADLYGVRATINVYEPKVKKGSNDASQTAIQIDNGPRGHVDSICVGYAVSPSVNGDNFARFHAGWRNGKLNKTCFDRDCPGFVQISHNVGLGGRVQPVSVYNGPQYVINILIFKDPKTKNWWLSYGEDNTPIGYWPSSLFTSINNKGNFSFWGGYVSGPTASSDSPQIGSGHFASEGYGKASFMRNIQIVDENSKLVTPNEYKDRYGTSDTRKYSVDGYKVNKYGMHMYYGGPGNLV
ncbi:hypothetical protein ACQ4PT_001209 [Festuca glaucescens]